MIPAKPFPFEGDRATRYEAEHLSIRWPEEWYAQPGWRPYNPSLAWCDGKLYMSVRYSFFAFPGLDITGHVLVSSNYYGRSETILAELDPETKHVLWWKFLTYRNWEGSRNTALEDVRIWADLDGLHGIGVFLHDDESAHSQGVIDIDPAEGTATLRTVIPSEHVEKNWSPVEGSNRFIYSPTQTVGIDGYVEGEPYSGSIHGGTPLIRWGSGYLSLVHHFTRRRFMKPNGRATRGRHYVHHWAEWSPERRLVGLSRPFVFTWESSIEFASGLVRDGDRLLVSYGWGDYDLSLITVDPCTIATEPFTEEARFLIPRVRGR